MIVGGLALLVIMIIVGALLVGNFRSAADDPIPSESVSGGNDASPDPASPTPTPQDSSSPSGPDQPPYCLGGNPDQRSPHPDDDRVYGGNVSFLEQRSFDSASSEPRLGFAWDVTQQIRIVSATPGWIAQLAVGQLRGDDGFTGAPEAVAGQALECAVTGGLYQPYGGVRRDRRSVALGIDGRKGWLIESDFRVTQAGLSFPGDRVIMVVVRDGDNWGMFFGAVPIGDQDLTRLLRDTVGGLRAG